MNLKITFKSGEEGVNRREFELDAHFMNPAEDTIAPLLIHLTDMLVNLHPGDLMEVIPQHVPEIARAAMARRDDSAGSPS
jgi:hypothetical protein